jgi:hypothetical protein
MSKMPLALLSTSFLVVGLFLWATAFSYPSPVKAQSNSESRIDRGFEIAPVPLKLEGKDRALVGLGSYLVNASGGCNDCHSGGPQTQYAPGGNPYFGQPTRINPATYLGGGRDFGPLLPTPGSPHIVSRNLTPATLLPIRQAFPKAGVLSISLNKSSELVSIWITCILPVQRVKQRIVYRLHSTATSCKLCLGPNTRT